MARPRVSDGEPTVLLSVKIPEALDKALQAFMLESGLKRSEAAREWLVRGSRVGSVVAAGRSLRNGSVAGRGAVPERGPARSAGVCPPHPVSRKIGNDCGACGALNVWKSR